LRRYKLKNLKKLKIYLDTSVISHLDQQDAPEKMEQTKDLWQILKMNKYDIIVGSTAIDEIEECTDDKKEILYLFLSQINYNEELVNEDTVSLAKEIVEQKILTEKNFDDCLHIATAILNDCNIIVSWNFKHMVNVKTINGIRTITLAKRYNTIDIYSPNILLEGDDENE
jgi:predicted nucleic acid-binding protein